MCKYTSNLSLHIEKGNVRIDIMKELSIVKKYGRFLSLPCLNFEIEKYALSLNYKVDVVEKNKTVYKEQLKHKQKNLKLYNTDVKEFLERSPRLPYDVMYLDLCNSLSYSFMDILIRCTQRTPLLYITAMVQRSKHFKNIPGSDLEKLRRKFIENGWQIEKEFIYTNNRSKMTTFKLIAL